MKQQLPKPNPSLKHLEVFVGDWDMEISKASFLSDLFATLKGHTSFEWLEGSAFLVMRQGDKTSPPAAIWVIGRDESTETYKMLYFDSRGVSRIYEMSFNDDIWKIWRDSPNFSQRFTATFSDDWNTITGQWEKSSDGSHWEHDFDLTYRRIK